MAEIVDSEVVEEEVEEEVEEGVEVEYEVGVEEEIWTIAAAATAAASMLLVELPKVSTVLMILIPRGLQIRNRHKQLINTVLLCSSYCTAPIYS
jgi:hypothetical protein